MKGKVGRSIGSVFLITALSVMVIVLGLDLINPEYTSALGRALRAERERLNTRLRILVQLTHKNPDAKRTAGDERTGEDGTSDSNSTRADNPSR
ncbi:MAG: hypothetical protein KDK34_15305 [Leptospiraceae bacterium]|nr:hypothetical protein [Leptospiraceae bacterium]